MKIGSITVFRWSTTPVGIARRCSAGMTCVAVDDDGEPLLIRFPTFPATLEPNRSSTRSATGY